LRAGGFDTRHGTVTLVDENRRLRETATEAFAAATQQMIDHFDGALTAFEAEVRDGKANVRVVSNHGKPTSGGGAIDGPMLLMLFSLMMLSARRRSSPGPSAPAPDPWLARACGRASRRRSLRQA
jgi:rhombotail lipoprotein